MFLNLIKKRMKSYKSMLKSTHSSSVVVIMKNWHL